MAARTLRHSRRSEPSKLPCSAATSPRGGMPRQRGGWEFPLSREEKKQRVMYLFQAELADAEQRGAENVEALQALLEKRSGAVDSDPKKTVADGTAAECTADIAGGARQRVSRARLESCSLGLLAGLGVLLVAWIIQPMPVVPSVPSSTNANLSLTVSLDLEVGDLAPNITDRAQGMRNEGHIRLHLSNCQEAAWWFSSARQLLSRAGNVSDVFQNHIVGEQGFALVCAKQFEEGARLLEQHLTLIGLNPGAAHLLNALGYANFYMKDLAKASVWFELSIRADEFNPVPWNNYAGVRMFDGDIKGAKEALDRAYANVKAQPLHQEHHITMIHHNLQVLSQISEGQSHHVPWMDLWNGYVY